MKVAGAKLPAATRGRSTTLRSVRTDETYSSAWFVDADADAHVTQVSPGTWTGNAYREGMTNQEIVAAVRRDIREATRRGDLPPGIKVSVTLPRNERNLRVVVTDAPGVRLIDPVLNSPARPSAASEAMRRRLHAIVRNYNHERGFDGRTARIIAKVDIDDALVTQQMHDIIKVPETGQREDLLLTASIRRALKTDWRSPYVLHAIVLGPSHWRLEWRYESVHGPYPPPVLYDQDVTSPGEALEFARAWHLETKASR